MNSLNLVPYNESMQLGQGFNSFLQRPCVFDAVQTDKNMVIPRKTGGQKGVPQVVSFSSRIVTKISEVTRSMNISAGASVRTGSITVSGNQSAIDEAKFAASDINAVISVKVINQTTNLGNSPHFNVIDGVKGEDEFHRVYGDSYISGFVVGGELHGIVSIRVLDSTQKEKVVSSLKQRLNGADLKSFALKTSDQISVFAPELKQSETSIFVNWCGGGQIKPADKPWTLESLFHAAAAFPNKVAQSPQRCWAILTRYPNNPTFRSSTLAPTTIRSYANAQQYAADLLDSFMVYKSNLLVIRKVLDEPTTYVLGPGSQPVDVRAEALVEARKKMKVEMAKIVSEIQEIDHNPDDVNKIMKKSDIESPEVWSTRLPRPKATNNSGAEGIQPTESSASIIKAIQMFRFVNKAAQGAAEELVRKVETAPLPETLGKVQPPLADSVLAPPDAQAVMSTYEKAFVSDMRNICRYAGNFSFDKPCGTLGRSINFNDAETIKGASVQQTWPKLLDLQMVHWGGEKILGACSLVYEQLNLSHGGSKHAQAEGRLLMELGPAERIISITMGFTDEIQRVRGINYIKVDGTNGHKCVGKESPNHDLIVCSVPEGFVGLKGFYGYHREGELIERIGVIWGK